MTAQPAPANIAPGGEGVVIVVNPSARSASAAGLAVIRERLPDTAIVELDEGDDLEVALEKAAATAKVLGVMGGDGTVNAAARVAVAHGLPLAVVPGGTLNHFAHEIGLRKPEDAVEAVRARRVATVDLGDIAGRLFLNNASIGGYPELVDIRERLEKRLGKWVAMLVALVLVLRRGHPLSIDLDGDPRRIWLLFAGNCRYQPSGFAPRTRPRLDDGQLDIRIIDAAPRFARIRLVLALLTGRLKECPVYEERVAGTVAIVSHEGPLRLACDGETFDGPARFGIGKRDAALTVVGSAPV